jgi:hypothetical protein
VMDQRRPIGSRPAARSCGGIVVVRETMVLIP